MKNTLSTLATLALLATGPLYAADSPAAAAPAPPPPAAPAAGAIKILPYPLDTCIVTGEKLGSMGKPVVRIYGQQEIKFCCNSCPKDFAREPAKYLPKIAAAQKKTATEAAAARETPPKPYAPATCLVTDKALGSMGQPVAVIYDHQEIKFCCSDCLDEFHQRPAALVSKLQAQAPSAAPGSR